MASSTPPASLADFIGLCGLGAWNERLGQLRASGTSREGKSAQQFHAIEIVLDRLSRGRSNRPLTLPEQRIATIATDAVTVHQHLTPAGKTRMTDMLAQALTAGQCLVPAFHLFRTAALQRSREFEVAFAGFEDAAPFDLIIRRGTSEAEVACDVVSAEEGRGVHRGAWFRLVDRIDPELQTWLRAHPGRYLLKLTFPLGLKQPGCDDTGLMPELHRRISVMLSEQRRADSDAALVLRLDPLMLAAAQADELGLMPRLREEFGPEAHLAVSTASGGIFVLAARAGQQNEIAAAVRRRMAAIVPTRLTGERPGILAMFIEDTDRLEWRLLREKLDLEGEARQFLTNPEARSVVAVTCCSRLELFGIGEKDAAQDGELRFRNQAHPAAKQLDLAPAVLSSM